LFPQKFLSVQFLLLDFAAYQKNKKKVSYFILLLFKISSIKKKEKTERQKKIIQKDVYWILPQKTKQGKIGSNQLIIRSNFRT